MLVGDDIIADPTTIWNRAITIGAGRSEVWPWLLQMGYGRAGFYVPEWVDRLLWRVPAANSTVVMPQFQDLEVNDIVADGPNFMAYWRERVLDPGQAIVYWTRRHPWRGAPPWLRRMPYALANAYLTHAELTNIKRLVERSARPAGPPAHFTAASGSAAEAP